MNSEQFHEWIEENKDNPKKVVAVYGGRQISYVCIDDEVNRKIFLSEERVRPQREDINYQELYTDFSKFLEKAVRDFSSKAVPRTEFGYRTNTILNAKEQLFADLCIELSELMNYYGPRLKA